MLKVAERGGAKTAEGEDTGLSVVQIIELSDGVASVHRRQGGGEVRGENEIRRRSDIDDDIEGMLATIFSGDIWLLLNPVCAVLVLIRGESVVVETVRGFGGLAVVGTERGAIGPGYGQRRNLRTEGDLGTRNGIKGRVNVGKRSRLLTVKVSGEVFPTRKTFNLTQSLRGSVWLANCPKT